MHRLFIPVKDRPELLAVLCKSLLHSDMATYINEVVFLDDKSKDFAAMQRVYSAFMYAVTARYGIRTRFVLNKTEHTGIDFNMSRIQKFNQDYVWYLDSDMMVCSDYFSKCFHLLQRAKKKHSEEDSILVSGFLTSLHGVIKFDKSIDGVKAASVGGCSGLFEGKYVKNLLGCLNKTDDINQGWDWFLHKSFDHIYVTYPSRSQHLGIYSGINQIELSGFPGAWATF